MQLVTVVNRTNRNLSGKWDGRDYVVPPGRSSHPLIIAEAIKRHNPIMGSDDLSTGILQYLVGIEEQGDPIDPIEQSSEIELYNRRLAQEAVPIMIVPGNTGMYSVRRNDIATPIAGPGNDDVVGFTKP